MFKILTNQQQTEWVDADRVEMTDSASITLYKDDNPVASYRGYQSFAEVSDADYRAIKAKETQTPKSPSGGAGG